MTKTARTARILAAGVAAALLVSAAPARADGTEEPPPPREVPDYDGRPEPPPTAGEIALWAPRVVFFPLYLVSEYVIRRPLGLVVSTVEEEEIPAKVMDVFTFGPGDRGRWAPTFLYEFGLRPSVGFFFWYQDVGPDDNEIKLHFATGGRDWLTGTVGSEYAPEGEIWLLGLRAEATRRPDGIFMGIGNDTVDENESRYRYRRLDARLELELEDFWRTSDVSLWGGVRDMDFQRGSCCRKPSVLERVNRGDFAALPPGFERGYSIYHQGGKIALDSRRPRPAPGHGVRLSTVAEHSFDLKDPIGRRWLRYGGALTLFVDLTGDQNVLSASVSAHAIEPLAGEVPFTELVHPSGDGPLQGFVSRRLIGLSQAAATVEYRWPIWNWLDAAAHVAAGNVFDEDFAGFELEQLRLSYGVGIKSSYERDQSFQLLLALGTDPLDEGANIESVRFTFGSTREF